ncbi:hypothetical protein BKX93_16555 [Chromobacterium vaccinii]|uniref:Uncharacterized protein n=1 Tax=Chromobacterium vaccinii TaxID=1108595 RepID=A0A1D9LNR7_9NEIS|nr:hypothetical protein BKX93_16555 [Chromobacterium vaccinii]
MRTCHCQLPFGGIATAYDHVVGTLVATGTEALGRSAPRANRHAAFASAAFTTTVRVVDRVHRRTANGRANTAPTGSASLTQLAQGVLFVTHFTNGRTAIDVHQADLARAQTQLSVHAFASQQHCRSASGTNHLSALAGLHFHAVDSGTHRDVADRQSVTGLDRSLGAGQQHGANFHAARSDDVAAFAIGVAQQGDVGGAVRIVFDAFHFRRDAILVATEVDQTVVLLMAATTMTRSDVAIVVTAAGRVFLLNQGCVRSTFVQVRVYHLDNGTAARGSRFYLNDRHALSPYSAAAGLAVRSSS